MSNDGLEIFSGPQRTADVYVANCKQCGAASNTMLTLEQCERWIVAHAKAEHPANLAQHQRAIMRGPNKKPR